MEDKQLTQDLEDFLNAPEGKRDLQKGAVLVLKFSRNQILYANMMRAPHKYEKKMVYELTKARKERIRRLNAEEAMKLQKTVIPAVTDILSRQYPEDDVVVDGETLKQFYGRRADHDSLPADIRDLWQRNTEIWHKIKNLHEKLKTMDDAPACERLEFLKMMLELEQEHTRNFAVYDAAAATAGESVEGNTEQQQIKDDEESPADDEESASDVEKSPADDASKINAARKYISDNRKKILTIDDAEKREALLAKIQDRYDYLIEAGANLAPEVVENLKEIGVNVGEKEDTTA